MLAIKKWSETFETADTRKRQRLGWFLNPSGCDSGGYIELMSHGERGIKAFAVFQAICQWSATNRQMIRGRLARSDERPLNMRQLAAHIRMPIEVVEDAVLLLTSEDVNWIVDLSNENTASAGHLPPICHQSAGHLPLSAGHLPVLLKEKEKEKDRKKEQEKKPPAADPLFDEFWKEFPRNIKKKDARKAWDKAIKSVEPQTILEGAKTYARQVSNTETRFIAHPTSWLNAERWEDEPEQTPEDTEATWNQILQFVRTDRRDAGYTERLKTIVGERATSAAKTIGVNDIAQANEFQISQMRKRFISEVKR